MAADIWRVPAQVIRIIDGDTYVLRLDLGWHIHYDTPCRLEGVDTPERGTEQGKAVKAFVEEVLGGATKLYFYSRRLDKFGRPLGELVFWDGETFIDLAKLLIQRGMARPYSGGKKEYWPAAGGTP